MEEKIQQYIKCIFAPGDPVLFHSVSGANGSSAVNTYYVMYFGFRDM